MKWIKGNRKRKEGKKNGTKATLFDNIKQGIEIGILIVSLYFEVDSISPKIKILRFRDGKIVSTTNIKLCTEVRGSFGSLILNNWDEPYSGLPFIRFSRMKIGISKVQSLTIMGNRIFTYMLLIDRCNQLYRKLYLENTRAQ